MVTQFANDASENINDIMIGFGGVTVLAAAVALAKSRKTKTDK